MKALWKHYDKSYEALEHDFPLAFPWNSKEEPDLPRYRLGDDGYWFDPDAPETGKALLSCMGDLMCEPQMTKACKFGNRYFFHPLFQYVRPILKQSDFSVANLETILGESTPYAGLYHRVNRQFHCNGPECYLESLRYAGFDALVNANNHNCDAGITGLFETLDALDRHQFPHTGTFRPSDSERVLFVKIRGIRVAILSYAWRFNSLGEANLTEEGFGLVLNRFSKEKIDRDTAHARKMGAQFILCYIHWGKDYDLEPNDVQRDILEQMQEADVDYIVGSHTHCLQKAHIATSKSGKKIPMMFSMGNFVTNEPKELCKHTAILQLSLTEENGSILVEEKLIPCYVFNEFDGSRFPVVPAHSTLNGGFACEKLDSVKAYVRERVGDLIPFLDLGETSLEEVCRAMELPVPEGLEGAPVVSLSAEVGPSTRGGLYFSTHPEELYPAKGLIRRHVTAAVTETPIEGLPCILTKDVKSAFEKACLAIKKIAPTPKTVLVAGIEGKTVTCELISKVLKTTLRVYTPEDDYQYDATPWQKIHPSCDVLVLELRHSHPMGAERLLRLHTPDVLVLTQEVEQLEELLLALPKNATVFYNETCPVLVRAIRSIQNAKNELIPFGQTILDHRLPFAHQAALPDAALAVGQHFGVAKETAKQAISDHSPALFPTGKVFVDDVHLILDLNCKTKASLDSAFASFAQTSGRAVCIFGSTSAATQEELIQMAKGAGAKQIFFLGEGDADGARFLNERDLERALLEELKDGDRILFLADRTANLNLTVRRLFGLCDGFMPNCEHYMLSEKLVF